MSIGFPFHFLHPTAYQSFLIRVRGEPSLPLPLIVLNRMEMNDIELADIDDFIARLLRLEQLSSSLQREFRHHRFLSNGLQDQLNFLNEQHSQIQSEIQLIQSLISSLE